ncbi:hypothetical protein ATCC90586_003541 [Pythium insidiosum]|nr:hypothetical protein ATCC90586_003541 [Pythium insidiosum]
MDPARTSDAPLPLPLPPARRHRRHTHESSEQPTASLRRIGEALLLAQNRARVSAERANRCERILRTVLSQANLPSAAVLHELQDEYPRSMSLVLSQANLPSAAVLHELQDEYPRSMSLDDDRDDLHTVARAVVLNLHVAARNAKRRISKLEAPVGSCRQVAGRGPVWFAVDGWFIRLVHLEVYGGFRPWQFVTGVVLGVIAGFLGTRRILRRPPAKMAPLIQDKTRRACLADRRDELAKLQLAASRLPVAFAMEDMSYLLPSAVEVTS